MMLLLCFDLPRDTKENRKQASYYRKRLIELGFSMKQYSLYERHIRKTSTLDSIIKNLKEDLPDFGSITLYLLPDKVSNSQITILGRDVYKVAYNKPKLIIL